MQHLAWYSPVVNNTFLATGYVWLVNVRFWPISVARLSITGCRAGKVADRHDRTVSTRSGHRISNLLGELTGSP